MMWPTLITLGQPVAYAFEARRVLVLDLVVDLEHVVVAHAGEDDQADAAEGAGGLEGDVVLLVVLDLLDDVVQVLAGNEDDDDDARNERDQVVHLEVGLLAAQEHRVDDDVEHDDPEARGVLDQVGEVLFEDALQNGEGAVEAVVTDVRKADDQEVALQKKDDFDLVRSTSQPNLRPCSTVTRMSE